MKTLTDRVDQAGQPRHDHADCWVCGPSNGHNLAVDFSMTPAGEIEARFDCDETYTGYAGYLHGGVVSCLLDGAMTNWLLTNGIRSVTADLQVRFRQPVITGETATIRAWLDRTRRSVHILGAELVQNGSIRATAVGKFMKHPDARR